MQLAGCARFFLLQQWSSFVIVTSSKSAIQRRTPTEERNHMNKVSKCIHNDVRVCLLHLRWNYVQPSPSFGFVFVTITIKRRIEWGMSDDNATVSGKIQPLHLFHLHVAFLRQRRAGDAITMIVWVTAWDWAFKRKRELYHVFDCWMQPPTLYVVCIPVLYNV